MAGDVVNLSLVWSSLTPSPKEKQKQNIGAALLVANCFYFLRFLRRGAGVRGQVVFHPAARRADHESGGQHGPLRHRDQVQPQLVQRRLHRAQGRQHLRAQHFQNSGQVRVDPSPLYPFLFGSNISTSSWLSCLESQLWCLTEFSVLSSDSGEYHCMVTPWYKSASSGLWTQYKDYTSGKVFLSVKFAGEEMFKKITQTYKISCVT